MTRVKICGITTAEDARMAAEAGAHALGFVFADSPRRIEARRARGIVDRLPPFVVTVGVFRDATVEEVRNVVAEAGVDVIQLHGDETPDDCARLGGRVLKRFPVGDGDTVDSVRTRVRGYPVAACLLDPGAGSGRTFPWRLGRAVDLPLVLGGGLAPDNVAAAIREARPWAVDVSSGVELAPGRKCARRVRAFLRAVREEDERSAAR